MTPPAALLAALRRALPPALPLLLAAAVFPAAAAADPFDRTWCEVEAGELRLVTDRSREEAEDLVRHMLAFRPVAESYLPGVPNEANPPLTVLVFERDRDFRQAVNGADVGGFMQPSFTENLMVVGPELRGQSPDETLFHEYVHYLLRTRTDFNIPAWFDEGLASALSSARITAREVEVGALPGQNLAEVIRKSGLSLADVLDAEDVWDWRRDRRLAFYAWSWTLTHRLMLGHETGRDDFRSELSEFLEERAPSLTSAVDVSAKALERRLLRYLDRSPPVRVTHPASLAPEAPFGFRCLDDVEKTLQLSLAITHHNPPLVTKHLERQLERHPDRADLWSTLSLAAEAAEDRDASLAAARRAVALAPDDVSAAVRLAAALAMGCILQVSEECRARWQEAVPLLRRSLRRDPTRQDAIFVLGLAYLYSGRAGDALNYLRIAHNRQPWAPHVNFYLGESYRLIGDVRAREHLTRARQWSPTEIWRRMAEAGLERLEQES